jgi:hypothetical protein
MPDQDGDVRADVDRRSARQELHPAHVELTPRAQRVACALEVCAAVSDRRARFVCMRTRIEVADEADRGV